MNVDIELILFKLLFSILFQPFIIYILMRTIGSCWVQIKMLFPFFFAQFLERFDEFLHSVNFSGYSIVFFIDEKKNQNNNSACSDVVCSNLINNIHISSAMYMYRLCLCY